MGRLSHSFHRRYRGPMVFGMGRESDEASFVVFLQRFSSDRLMEVLSKRLSNEEIQRVVDCLTDIMRRHLSHEEYHQLFLGDADE
jgi:hypothetical protein